MRLLALVLLAVVLAWPGCNSRDKDASGRAASVSQIGSVTIAYLGSIDRVRQDRLDEAARLHMAQYERITGNPVRAVRVHVLIDQGVYLHCGGTNLARGCYDWSDHRIRVMGGSHDEIPWLTHELHHAAGFLGHSGVLWSVVNRADRDLQLRLILARP